ncbi:MAG: hypothetical protein Rubg2KO_09660 [Rubricoccaceae bacterium]
MDILTQYEIPYLHPLAVHFPLVLLLLGAAASALYAGLGTATWRWAALILIVLGAASSIWAEETGETLADTVDGEPIATVVLPDHKDGAEWTVRVSILTVLVLASLSVWARRQPERFVPKEPLAGRILVLLLAGLAAGLVAWTAHLGGIMVWGVPT